jgi:hypothetical protein
MQYSPKSARRYVATAGDVESELKRIGHTLSRVGGLDPGGRYSRLIRRDLNWP